MLATKASIEPLLRTGFSNEGNLSRSKLLSEECESNVRERHREREREMCYRVSSFASCLREPLEIQVAERDATYADQNLCPIENCDHPHSLF